MGQEIDGARFSKRDFSLFAGRLREETALLANWFANGQVIDAPYVAGFEIEACLVDSTFRPIPKNAEFLAELDSPLTVPELARFNVEHNSRPYPFEGRVLHDLEQEMEAFYREGNQVAANLGAHLLLTGILPSLQEEQLNLRNMSALARYRAINEQIMRQRRRIPFRVDIQGRDHLVTEHRDVMLESATTSLQLHLQVPQSRAVRCFNAAQIATAPVLALAVNSPFVFGHSLWAESRIPMFEQSVDPGRLDDRPRVTFGEGYIEQSVMEYFEENLHHYPVMLPRVSSSAPALLQHLQLHNGTIWRWNRPIVEVDEAGQARLRIENRSLPAGPTVTDAIANAAFFFGLVAALSTQNQAPESKLDFVEARNNFYRAAQFGLDAELVWLDGRRRQMAKLIEGELLPLALRGLLEMGLRRAEAAPYIDILLARVRGGQTGARWQRAYVEHWGDDMQALTAAYYRHQQSGECVHNWPVD